MSVHKTGWVLGKLLKFIGQMKTILQGFLHFTSHFVDTRGKMLEYECNVFKILPAHQEKFAPLVHTATPTSRHRLLKFDLVTRILCRLPTWQMWQQVTPRPRLLPYSYG